MGLHLSLTVPRGVCRAVLTVSTGFATGSRKREGEGEGEAGGEEGGRSLLDDSGRSE